ncbi:MAG TPA: MBL fold metallo-hydrolase [Bryobacteraceae bacterium]|jgi:glyoxylase-like metal-dependent hydrolase (beta-lactamase superfamily II)
MPRELFTRPFLIRSAAGMCVLAGAWFAFTQNRPPAAPMVVNKISGDLYELELSGNGNVALYLTGEGVIVVDDKFEQNHDEIMANIKKLTDKPVKYVLNTHHHGDHTGGNAKMLALGGVQILIQKNARANMVQGKQPGLPQITYTDQAQVFLGGKEVDAFYNGKGHTNGDVAIYFPALRVVHTGDLFTTDGKGSVAPILDYNGGASAAEWTKTLDGILKLDFDTVIPGHGSLAKRADLMAYRAGFEKMVSQVRDLSRQGKAKDDISKMLQTNFGWGATGMGMNSLDRMIAELK